MQIRFIRLIDDLFANLPQSREILELKEEMVQNLMEKYNDLISEGKSEEAAFSIAAASVGDVNELIAALSPHAPEPQNPFDYGEAEEVIESGSGVFAPLMGFGGATTVAMVRHRMAAFTALGVMLCILCPVPVILFQSAFGVVLLLSMVAAGTGAFIYMGMTKPKKHEMPPYGLDGGYPTLSRQAYRHQTAMITAVSVMLYILCAMPVIFFQNAFGVSLMFLMIAAATGMLIYDSMSRPKRKEMTDDYGNAEQDGTVESYSTYVSRSKKENKKATKSISSAVSGITLALYFLISFQTGAWHVSWVIFLLGAAANNIIKAMFDLRRGE